MDDERTAPENNGSDAEKLREQNEALLRELRELKESFKAAFNTTPPATNPDDEFDKEIAKLLK